MEKKERLKLGIVLLVLLGAVFIISWLPSPERPVPKLSEATTYLLKGAYNGRGLSISFSKTAQLEDITFSASSLREKTEIPENVEIGIYCEEPLCTPEPKAPSYETSVSGSGTTSVCTYCTKSRCGVFIGKEKCKLGY